VADRLPAARANRFLPAGNRAARARSSPPHLHRIAALAAEDEQIATMRVGLQRLLHEQREAGKAALTRGQPDASAPQEPESSGRSPGRRRCKHRGSKHARRPFAAWRL
jgi:hypothetical protein